eukprot:TRINITY_DN9899_c0_g1_i3.p1 TRINITY_DN9899_c0_g1~~TRINITY_DN9899_c0_g1_i3.p1  ORF type:complete len:877 (-),score=247.53 TRINITY_DN9899_c0_g1_i3:669-3185(-)
MGGLMRKRSCSESENFGAIPLKKARVIDKLEKCRGEMISPARSQQKTVQNQRCKYVEEDAEISFKITPNPSTNSPSPQKTKIIQKENIQPTKNPKNNLQSPSKANNKTPKTAAAATTEVQQQQQTAAANADIFPPSSAKSSGQNGGAEEEVDTREMNRRSPNGFLLPDPLPKGEILVDSLKQEWVLGKPIGLGGFGELYLAAQKVDSKLSPENYVIKIEPHSNGPLFVEVHFYIRATAKENIDAFKQKQKLKHLGVPQYIGSGTHRHKGKKFRFLVMERFGSDLQRILDHSEGGRFTDKTVCEVGVQVLDALQYIHKQGYVHKDVKAANLLVGLGMVGQHKVHLVDYGLCSRFKTGDIHKQYIHDERWAHEGTLEYTSRDSHIGCTSRRGDIEVLLYNLIEWWGGSLPWDRDIANPTSVKIAKFRAFKNPHRFLRHCFRRNGCNYPQILNKLMHYIINLRFEDEPDYSFLRSLFRQQMKTFGCVSNGRLEFRLGVSNLPVETEIENLEYLKPLEPDTRVSGVFDRLCVSARSWESAREEMIERRNEEALRNPTPAMRDIQNMIRERARAKAKAERLAGSGGGHNNGCGGRHRRKSFTIAEADKTEHTPAMLEVMRSIQLKKYKQEIENKTNDDGITAVTGHISHNKTVIFKDTADNSHPIDEGIDIAAKLADPDDVNSRQNTSADDTVLLPKGLLRVSPIPPEVVSPIMLDSRGSSRRSSRTTPPTTPTTAQLPPRRTKSALNVDIDRAAVDVVQQYLTPAEEKRRRRELSRLDIFLPPPPPSSTMRTRSADIVVPPRLTRSADVIDDGTAVRSLRSAFKFGVSKLFRQVSDSFTNIF